MKIRIGQTWMDPEGCSWRVVGLKSEVQLSGPGSCRGMISLARDTLLFKWTLLKDVEYTGGRKEGSKKGR